MRAAESAKNINDCNATNAIVPSGRARPAPPADKVGGRCGPREPSLPGHAASMQTLDWSRAAEQCPSRVAGASDRGDFNGNEGAHPSNGLLGSLTDSICVENRIDGDREARQKR